MFTEKNTRPQQNRPPDAFTYKPKSRKSDREVILQVAVKSNQV